MPRHALLALLPLLGLTIAQASEPHFHDGQKPLGDEFRVPDPADWASVHMHSEHHIDSFDARTFFNLHDYDADGRWETGEILRTYGLAPDSTNGIGGPGASIPSGERVPEDAQIRLLQDMIRRFDLDWDGVITAEEFEQAWNKGERLRDWEWGPGHHGDDEFEYEVHHFERFHDENTTEEELTHPEDIAHFKAHEEREEEEERQAEMDQLAVVDKNIPAKFRRHA